MNEQRLKNSTKKTVLVVDDDPKIRSMLTLTLEIEGYHVMEAENGNAALNILRTRPADLVVSDIQMPGGDGIYLLTELRRQMKDPPPLMFVSAHRDITDIEVKTLGAIGLVQKPFDPDSFVEELKNILSRD